MTSSFGKFQLLVWKNAIIQKRHKKQTIFEILFPIFLTALLVLLRGSFDPEKGGPKTYKPFDPDCAPVNYGYRNNFSKSIAYSPSTPLFDKIANQVLIDMDRYFPKPDYLTLKPLEDSAAFNEYLLSNNPFFGIEFTNQSEKRLDYVLRFRGLDGDQSWQTDQLIEINKFSRVPQNENIAMRYNIRCFLSAQNAVDRAFMNVSGVNLNQQSVLLNRFAQPTFVYDQAFEISYILLPFFLVMSFMNMVRNIIKDVALEKEKQLKESLKMVGLSNWLHWSAWFFKSFMFLLFILTIVAFLLTTKLLSSNKIAVVQHSDPFLLWLFLMCYAFAYIGFCFLMSLAFRKATTASAVGYLVWILTFVPYIVFITKFNLFNYYVQMGFSLFVNSGMGFGMMTILKLEVNSDGLQWHNLFSRLNENKFSVADSMFGLLLSFAVMMLLTLYFEQVFPGEFGVPRKWYFPLEGCLRWFSGKNYNNLQEANGDESKRFSETFEDEPADMVAGIKIQGLTKIYKGKQAAVDRLYLNMYQDQITVLLGHNGAGKTTTMSMLTGLFPPTSGTAIIDGKDIRTDIDKVRESLGLCPQHNVLFDELTVEEHIIFFCKLKGMDIAQVITDTEKYLRLLELTDKKDAQSHTLSGGMKRKLSIAIALCGRSKIVMMDEPTSGMDPAARRRLWDLLIEEKQGRTILLSTHFMDEADVLGDRIAVMAEGDLKAVGSSFFLKKKFGVGYRVSCVKTEYCEPEKIASFIKSYVPKLEMEEDNGTELIYGLSTEYLSKFNTLFSNLEQNMKQLHISSFGVSYTPMEEVFLKIANDADTLEKRRNAAAAAAAGHSSREDVPEGAENHQVINVENTPIEYLTGFWLILNQFIAMLKKKFYYMKRNFKFMLGNMIFTIFGIMISFMSNPDSHPALKMDLQDYRQSVTVIQQSSSDSFMDFYKRNVEGISSIVQVQANDSMDRFILQKVEESFDEVNNHYIVGASIFDNKITAWFNQEFLHTMPLSLNLVHRAILKSQKGNEYDITVTNHPFYVPNSDSQVTADILRAMQMILLLVFLTIIFANWSSAFISFYIKERECRAKLLQIISGVNKTIFWVASYFFDFVIMVVISLVVVGIIGIYQKDGYSSFEELFRLFVIFAMFSFAVLPMVYLFSHLFTQGSTGETMNTLLGMASGLILFGVYFVLSIVPGTLGKVFTHLYWVFLLSPHFALCDVLSKLIKINFTKSFFVMDTHNHASVAAEDIDSLYWNLEKGISGNLLAFFAVGLFYLVLLLVREYRLLHKLFYKCSRKSPTINLRPNMDQDVSIEIEKVSQLDDESMARYSLVLQNLTKFYGSFLAVKKICLAVRQGSCFGLLGANGAGKTSVFKMLTGDETISDGDAFLQNLSVKNQLNEVHKLIGYCPQFDAVLEDLTGGEIMEIFSMSRGIPRKRVNEYVLSLAKKLNFDRYLKRQVKAYSGGNKRKLSTALSLIGEPEVIFLDEPTTGMDPGAKRKLWNVINALRNNGKTVILTSHSMEECEALCNRLAIMVNGEFKCLGTTQHLKSKFSRGFILSIKAGRNYNGTLQDHISRIKLFVANTFPGASLKEEYLDMLTYQIENSFMKWSAMFGLMEVQKEILGIDDYSLGQTSLEQVFLFFTKNANNPPRNA